jgi:hypothetical protein
MKSQIRVDYRYRYSGNFGEKEPIVKVDVEQSDDPRDSLLAEIFHGDPPRVSIFKSWDEKVSKATTYFISRKTKLEQVTDIGSEVFQVLIETVKDKTGLIFVTGADYHWFEKEPLSGGEGSRSKGVNREELSTLDDREVRIRFVQDFLEFTKSI